MIKTLFQKNCIDLFKAQYCGKTVTNPLITRTGKDSWPSTDVPSDYVNSNIALPNKPKEQPEQLNLIFGEAPLKLGTYIYGNNKTNCRNQFLPPNKLLSKKSCAASTGYDARDLHIELLRRSIIVIDLFPGVIPTNTIEELYKNIDLSSNSNGKMNFDKEMINEILSIAKCMNVKKIKSINRYKRLASKKASAAFEFHFDAACRASGIVYMPLGGHLSNTAGGLDIKKLNTVFI